MHLQGLTEIVVALTILVSLRARPLGLLGLQELDDAVLRWRGLARLRTRTRSIRPQSRTAAVRPPGVEFRSRFVKVDGASLEIWDAGQGAPAAVYQHPYELRADPSPGGAFADALARATRTIVVAPRGLGRSSPPRSVGELRVDRLVDDLETVRDALGMERWVVAASGLGSMPALEYALRHPEATAGLVLGGGTASWRFYEDPFSIYSPTHAEAWREEAARRALDGSTAAERAWLQTVLELSLRKRRLLTGLVRSTSVSASRLGALRDELLGDPPWDIESRLEEIEAPSLVLAGSHDRQIPLSFARVLCERLPHAELVLFEASGSLPAEEEPERFVSVVAAFLARVAAADRRLPEAGWTR